ncbi:MAG TPA: A/G-specific adenine glycosylase [Rudaea sp.]|nr:A/G-specific adenine glycosylase [Rudaea sp.]
MAPRLLRWYARHGRSNLPWQHPRSAYRVWLSEVMLQQTQVATVIPYFLRFVDKLPNLSALAHAPLDDVLALWSGLGYYSRARNLQRSARLCVTQHGADLPRDFEALAALPGIGRSTAGAILAQAHGLRFPILDGNVKRVLARWGGIKGWPGATSVNRELWTLAELQTPRSRVADYTQAIMDLGATVCVRSRPRCADCPLADDCVAHAQGLTAKLPERKPKRKIPTRKTIMLVLRDTHGRLLIERRPPTGVWAGLWSLPEATDRASARRDVARYGGRINAKRTFAALAPFVHGFSHYRLEVTPLMLNVPASRQIADDHPDRRWVYPEQAAGLGLPAPVRKLIASLAQPRE